MKSTIIAALTLVTLQSTAQVEKTDRSAFDLKGPVKFLSTATFLAEEQSGKLVKDGEEFMTEAYLFNKDGLITSVRETDEEDVFNSRLNYLDNKLVEVKRYQGKEELVGRMKLTYNEQGLQSIIYIYDAEGDLEEKTVLSYNSKNQLVKEVNYDGDGQKTSETIKQYNSDGRLAKETETFRNSDDKMETKLIVYTYNTKGQVVTRDELENDGERKVYKLEYDQFDNVIKEYADAKTYYKYTYEYDSKNNWTVQHKTHAFLNTKAHYITERIVRYY